MHTPLRKGRLERRMNKRCGWSLGILSAVALTLLVFHVAPSGYVTTLVAGDRAECTRVRTRGTGALPAEHSHCAYGRGIVRLERMIAPLRNLGRTEREPLAESHCKAGPGIHRASKPDRRQEVIPSCSCTSF